MNENETNFDASWEYEQEDLQTGDTGQNTEFASEWTPSVEGGIDYDDTIPELAAADVEEKVSNILDVDSQEEAGFSSPNEDEYILAA